MHVQVVVAHSDGSAPPRVYGLSLHRDACIADACAAAASLVPGFDSDTHCIVAFDSGHLLPAGKVRKRDMRLFHSTQVCP